MSRSPIDQNPTRRKFLKTSSAAVVAASVAPLAAARTVHGGANEELKVGLIGCGGRGRGAAFNALSADPNTRLVALADTFSDQVDAALKHLKSSGVGERVDVNPEMQLAGFDAYKPVIENCDVILLATTPHFRPMHMKAAVDAGKHIFCEKPIATDAPGVRSVMESCRRAKEKGINVVSGLCYRYQHAKRETLRRIHGGEIGDIVSMQTTYNTGGLWHRGRKEHWSDMEWQIRNWLYFAWLSGDHIAEQHIHSLDKVAWAMQDKYPTRCTSTGGRIVRTDPKYGNVYDHFNTVYEWEDDVKGFSSCRQWVGAASDVSDHIYGTKGVASLQQHRIEGENKWRWRSRDQDGPDDMYQNEHDELFAAIRAGKAINNGEYMCKSTLMAIMARMSAYTGQTITWDQARNSQEDLSPKSYEWGPIGVRPVAQPGITKFS